MKISADTFVSYLRYPAALLDMRYLLIFVFFCLLAGSREPAGGAAIVDKSLFHLAGILQNAHLDGSDYIKVSFSADEQKQFLEDPVSARELMAFFDELNRSFVRSVAVILPRELPQKTALEQLLTEEVSSRVKVEDPAVEEQLKAVSSRWKVLESIKVNQKYVFVIRESLSERNPYNVFTVPGYTAGWYGNLLDATPVLPAAYPVLERRAPLLPSSGLAQPLLWKAEGSSLRHDAVLEVFLRQQGVSTVEIQNAGIRLGEQRTLTTSAQGVIYPRGTIDQIQKAGVTSVSVSDLLKQNVKRSVHDKNLVISAVDNPDADQFLNSLISLEQGYYASVPDIYPWLDVAMLALVLLFALLVPYCSVQIGLLIVGLLLVIFILTQQIMLLVHSLWIPVGEWLLFLLSAYFLMLLSAVKQGVLSSSANRLFFFQFKMPSLPRLGRDEKRTMRVTARPGVLREPSFRESDDELTDFDAGDTVMMDAATIRETRRQHNQEAQTFFRREPAAVRNLASGDRKMLGPYEIMGELGRGAMGVVYLGFDPGMQRKVAIKTLHYDQFDPIELVSMKERFLAEAKAVGQLRHNNIVTMHELKEEKDIAYIAMEYVAGKSLASYTSKDKLLPVGMVYWIMAEVADALAYAHAAGIVHRDVKPSNILYDENSHEVKVADFGVARLLDSTLAKTRTGEVLGSPLYMSPEQIRGEKVTGQSDIYSLGVTFYQLLTGEFPFKADNIATLTRLILQGKYPAVDEVRPGLPASARKIISKALQKNLDSRYSDAMEMVAALDQALKKDFS